MVGQEGDELREVEEIREVVGAFCIEMARSCLAILHLTIIVIRQQNGTLGAKEFRGARVIIMKDVGGYLKGNVVS